MNATTTTVVELVASRAVELPASLPLASESCVCFNHSNVNNLYSKSSCVTYSIAEPERLPFLCLSLIAGAVVDGSAICHLKRIMGH